MRNFIYTPQYISILSLLLSGFFLFGLFAPQHVFAAPCPANNPTGTNPPANCTPVGTNPPCTDKTKLCNPIKYGNLDAFFLAILKVVVQYGALLVVFFIVYAGFQFVTAQGDTEKIATARKMFVWVIVGAFVLLGVYVIRAAICGTLIQIGVQDLQC